jgi:uncharacterized RDD family membrane protein YckC
VTTPSDPYGEPTPGGTPPPPPSYGSPPPAPAQYGQQPPAYGQPAGPPTGQLAGWGDRVVAALIDYMAPGILAGLIFQASASLGILVYLVALAWTIYNKYLEGTTGQSYGKKIANTRLVLEATGQNVGPGLAIGRYFVHVVDAIPCYLGFLWPLWDAKKQTFADKLLNTLVVKV